ADHIYKMDVMQMVTAHIQSGAECTVSAMPVPIEEASQYGIMAVDDSGRIVEFQEKPERPAPMPGDASRALASMGNYVFTRAALVRAVTEDARSRTSSNDLGKNIVPMFVKAGAARAYSFADNRILGADPTAMPYWRDVGTLDSYYEACTDLVSVSPKFDLYNPLWPIMSHYEPAGPAKFVFADRKRDRIGMATDSMVCEGCIISGGQVDHSVLGPRVRINSFAEVESSILFEGVNVGRRARIRNAIVDKDVDIPPDTIIGFDAEADRERFAMTESGIVIIPKSAKLARRVRSVEPSLRADPLAPRLG
ncbi:MAG: glucose-1-phosphate adenylyltransferase, partial [Myxococcales bacterium]|nr:glucose-1-phosphate adenylyltransferase [Myxococcales bacterium]